MEPFSIPWLCLDAPLSSPKPPPSVADPTKKPFRSFAQALNQ
ncbi:hypothetical protein A2U01_0108441, partial [Trifolium medium]|nr:hypothetical protein [Trifolium medium]